MATTAARTAESFSAEGRIFDALSKQGLANLLVTAYHVGGAPAGDGDAHVERQLKAAARVGSVLSDDTGQFSVTYDERDIAAVTREGSRLNLMLVVSAPDDETSASPEKVIYHSNPPRENAGRTEHFNIGISRQTLEKFALQDELSAESGVSMYERDRIEEKELAEGVATFHRAALEEEMVEKAALREELLKAVTTDLDLARFPGPVIRGEDSIEDKVMEVAASAAASAVAEIDEAQGVSLNLFLLPEDRTRLAPFFNAAIDGFADIPEVELLDILSRANSSENAGTLLVHSNPITRFCAEQSADEVCATEHTGLSHDEHADGSDNADADGNGTGSEEIPVTDSMVLDLIARLLEDVRSPGSVFSDAFEGQRPTKADVMASVSAFALDRGPADVPAFYDFHSLQIAFEHVWKVLVDEEMVNVAHRLDRKHRQKSGVRFLEGLTHDWVDAVSVTDAYEAVLQEVPADVSAQFDITLQEWIDLSATHQARLLEISRRLADTESERTVTVSVPIPNVDMRVSVPIPASRFGSVAFEKQRQDLESRASA
jgi:hypothetical protein